MKTEKIVIALTAAVLSGLLAVSAVGCLVTGFDLDVESLSGVYFLCGAAAVAFSALFSQNWGGGAAALIIAPLALWLWYRGTAWEQLQALLVRISKVYHGAYDWGYFLFEVSDAPADLPLAVLGGLIALSASRRLVRGKGILPALVLSAFPLAACMVVTDTVPDTVFLFLLLAGFTLCMIPQSVRRESPIQGCRLTGMVAIPILLALGVLFLVVPQEGYVNQSKKIQEKILTMAEELPQRLQDVRKELSIGAADDGQQNLNLKQLGPRPRYTHAVMEVTAGTDGPLYLRGQDYDAYTGIGWTASPHRAENFGTVGSLPDTVFLSTRGKKDLYYLPYYPARDTILAGGAMKNPQGEKEYSFSYTALPENWREILEAEEATQSQRIELTDLDVLQFGSTADRLRYTTLPGQTKVAAEKILSEILPERASRWETADIIAEFVLNSAEYDLNTGRMPKDSADFALWFLEESETGYCVHFATAAVVLLRAADIPARYVTGYLTHTRAGEPVTVTAGEAHAWAEYYVPQLETWVPLEVTPAEEVTLEVPSTAAGTETRETIPLVTEGVPPEVTQPPVLPDTPTQPPAAEDAPRSYGWLYGLLGILLTLGAIGGQRQLRLILRQKRLEAAGPNKKALLLWAEAVQLSHLLKQAPPEALEKLAQKAKFSQHTLTEEDLALFEDCLSACRRQLKEHPWCLQIAYRLVFVVY